MPDAQQTLNDDGVALRDVIAEALRERIVSGQLLPGDRLREDDLCSQHNASRVPVREALARLQTEGFVSVTKYRGASVAAPSTAAGLDLVRVRQDLEGLAAELAAQAHGGAYADQLRQVLSRGQTAVAAEDYAVLPGLVDEFHALLALASGNGLLVQLLEQLRFKMRWVFQRHLPQRAAERWSDHTEILQAILSGFPGLARQLAERHAAGDAWVYEALGATPDVAVPQPAAEP